MALDAKQAYTLSPAEYLRSTFVGKSLRDVPTPAAIIDRAKAEQNCALMLTTVKDLGVTFRAHVKTHKSTEMTRMQVGAECKDVRLIVSTIVEVEHLVPLLLEYRNKGAAVDVLYGVPLGQSQVERLAQVGQQLGPGSITVMIDYPSQLTEAAKFKSLTGFPISIFIKADSGTHRAGLNSTTAAMATLIKHVVSLEQAGEVSLKGIYSHAGHSYAGSSPEDAMEMLKHEISTCQSALQHLALESRTSKHPLTISVGASPTALSVQNLTSKTSTSATATSLSNLITQLSSRSSSQTPSAIPQTLELHAGVYPLLDMQQLATQARPVPSSPTNPTNPVALTILTQVHSLYPPHSRASSQHQALIAAGSLALGREPCKSYAGWGVVSQWNRRPEAGTAAREIIVASISQEHGILAPVDARDEAELGLEYGQKLRIYPNHACIACAMYSFYLVIDSSAATSEERDRVVDVWVRWRGW